MVKIPFPDNINLIAYLLYLIIVQNNNSTTGVSNKTTMIVIFLHLRIYPTKYIESKYYVLKPIDVVLLSVVL